MELNIALLHDIGSRIERARHVLLLNPEGGDGDSLGATFALANMLTKRKQRFSVFALHNNSPTYAYLPRFAELIRDAAELRMDRYDLIVTVDFANLAMSGVADLVAQRNAERCPIISIDHHQTHEGFGDINYNDPSVGAACELVYELFRAQQWEIDPDVATCLLTGIVSDTGLFAHPNTTQASFQRAGTLIGLGGRLQTILNWTLRSKSLSSLQLWGRALERLQHDQRTGIVSTYLTQRDFTECHVDETAAEGIANFLNALDARATLLVRELHNGHVKGSYRTVRDDIDVAALAAQYGGGGHRRAAGFSVPGRLSVSNGAWKLERTDHGGQASPKTVQ